MHQLADLLALTARVRGTQKAFFADRENQDLLRRSKDLEHQLDQMMEQMAQPVTHTVVDRHGYYWFYDPDILNNPVPIRCGLADKWDRDSGYIFRHPVPEFVPSTTPPASDSQPTLHWCHDFPRNWIAYIDCPNFDKSKFHHNG